MADFKELGVSRALFSLGTGVEVAVGQRDLQAVERAKQASVLFDEIIIESGLQIVEIPAGGAPNTRRIPRERVSPDLLLHSRTLEEGTTSGMGLRRVDDGVEILFGSNLPRLEGCTYHEWPVAYRYISEYHTGLLDNLARRGADWVRVVRISEKPGSDLKVVADDLSVLEPIPGATLEPLTVRLTVDEARDVVEQLNEALQRDESGERPLPKPRALEDAPLVEALKNALQLAHGLSAVPALSSAFGRIAAERGVSIQLPGVESLGFLVPNFSVLPWEEIARFRDHQGSVEARARLREFESEVASRELPGSARYVRETGQAVSSALMATARELAPSLPDDVRGPVLGSAVGLIPVVGQFASMAVSMGDIVAALHRSQEFEGSWVAAVFELRDAAADAAMNW